MDIVNINLIFLFHACLNQFTVHLHDFHSFFSKNNNDDQTNKLTELNRCTVTVCDDGANDLRIIH